MKYWMLLEERETKNAFFWNMSIAIMVNDLIYWTTVKENQDMVLCPMLVYPDMNAACQQAYDTGSRIVTAGGKTFEVLASGRV